MILAIAAVMIGCVLLALFGGYALARWQFSEALWAARAEANLYRRRCVQQELDLAVWVRRNELSHVPEREPR